MDSIKIGAGDELFYRILNARMIEVYTNSLLLKTELDGKNNITALAIGSLVIKQGEKFIHNEYRIPSSYTISKIEKGASLNNKFKHRFTLFSHIRNKTTDYILPCLGKNFMFFDVDGYLINAYLGKDDKLYLLYRFASTQYYDKLEHSLVKHPNFFNIDSNTPGFDVFIFCIPEYFLDDVKTFKKGRYSKLSNTLKYNIKSFYSLKDKSNLWKILTKDAVLVKEKEDEFRLPKGFLWNIDLDEKPKVKDENWEYNNIIQK